MNDRVLESPAAPASPDSRVAERELLDRTFDELFPLLRSITGEGLRRSFEILSHHLPLVMESVPTGTRVFDWDVPPEWRIRRGRLTGPDGAVVCDFARCNLEVINYSAPVDRHLSLEELQPHLHSMPRLPAAIPYVTSYYHRTWGFCLPENIRARLQPGRYHAHIDSDFVPGGVPLGQALLPGESTREILLSSYLCHPSMANNELSGPLALLALFRRLERWPRRRFTYRFVLHPETIGSLCFLHRWGEHLRAELVSGLVLTCLGGPRPQLSYKQSRRGDTLADRLVRMRPDEFAVRPFDPNGGSDERQHCSPGFNLPVSQVARTVYGQYEEYHSSLDTKEFMDLDQVVRSVDTIEELLRDLDGAAEFRNLCPYGEPQLGRRNLYPTLNAATTRDGSTPELRQSRRFLDQILTVLNWSDGEHSMLDIAEKAGVTVRELQAAVQRLEQMDLLRFAPRTPVYRRMAP